MTYTEGRHEFERMLAAQMHHLRDATAEYATGLSSEDKDDFLRIAIEAAWEHRDECKAAAGPRGLPQFWRRCLKYAATSRERWLVSVGVLPGVYETRWVLGTMLGRV